MQQKTKNVITTASPVPTHPIVFFDLYFLNFDSYGVNRICILTRETAKLGLFRMCFVYTNKQSKLLLPEGDKAGYCPNSTIFSDYRTLNMFFGSQLDCHLVDLVLIVELTGKARIFTDDLIPKVRLCRNRY